MERASLLDGLNRARKQIEEVSPLISRQRIVLAELIVARRDTTAARDALTAMKAFMVFLTARRNQLEQELATADQSTADAQ